MNNMMILTGISFSLLFANTVLGVTPAFIESQPDGKRVLEVSEKEIVVTATGKTALYLDGNNLLTNIHDPAVLVVDDSGPGRSPWLLSLPEGVLTDPKTYDSEDRVKSASLSPDNQWLAGGGNEGSIFLWKIAN